MVSYRLFLCILIIFARVQSDRESYLNYHKQTVVVGHV